MTAPAASLGSRTFPIRGPSPRSRLRTHLLLLALLGAAAAVAAIFDGGMGRGMLLGWLVAAPVIELFAVGARRSRLVVDADAMHLHAPLARQSIRWGSVRAGDARLVDLARERDLRPRWRQMGLGFVDWGSGWFSLRGGRDALVAASYDAPAVLVPWGTRSLLLVTPEDAPGFLEEVRRRAAS